MAERPGQLDLARVAGEGVVGSRIERYERDVVVATVADPRRGRHPSSRPWPQPGRPGPVREPMSLSSRRLSRTGPKSIITVSHSSTTRPLPAQPYPGRGVRAGRGAVMIDTAGESARVTHLVARSSARSHWPRQRGTPRANARRSLSAVATHLRRGGLTQRRRGAGMQIVVFGATGRIGSKVVDEGLSRGWNVRAATRGEVRPGIRTRMTMIGIDLDDPERVGAAVGDADAVIACLGPRRNSADQVAVFAAAARRIVSAMERQHVFRLIIMSGAGVRLPDERQGRADGLLGPIEGRPGPLGRCRQAGRVRRVLGQPPRMDGPATTTRRRWATDRALQAQRRGARAPRVHHAGRHRGRDRGPGARRTPAAPGPVPVDASQPRRIAALSCGPAGVPDRGSCGRSPRSSAGRRVPASSPATPRTGWGRSAVPPRRAAPTSAR